MVDCLQRSHLSRIGIDIENVSYEGVFVITYQMRRLLSYHSYQLGSGLVITDGIYIITYQLGRGRLFTKASLITTYQLGVLTGGLGMQRRMGSGLRYVGE